MGQRNAQGYIFGLGSVRAAAAGTLTGTLQIASLLQDLSLQFSVAGGLVTAIRVAGQNILVSNLGCDINMWAPNCQLEGHRSMGIPLDQQQQVSIDYTLSGAGNASGGIGSDPISPTQVIPVNSLGPALDYAAGLGTVAAAGAAAFVLQATILRPVHLGRMVLTASVPDDITVRSVTVNNIELMSGAAGIVGECAIETWAHTATDVDGLTLDYYARANDIITISCNNYNAGAQRVDGGIFILPPPAPMPSA
jgi:hypothetical protein